jgi:hypothetical protein
MTEQKIYNLMIKLLARTRAGDLTWEGTTSDEAYLTSLATFSVKVSQVWDDYGRESNILLSISDSGGRAIEGSRDDELADKLHDPAVRVMMRDLYTEARRAALGVDAALDKLLSELEE